MSEAFVGALSIAGGFFLIIGLIILAFELVTALNSPLAAAVLFIVVGGGLLWYSSSYMCIPKRKKKRK